MPLLGETSPFQATVLRMAALTGGRPPVIVAGADHAEEIERQLDALGQGQAILLLEPEGRNSAPAIAAAAAWIGRDDPDGLAVAAASDHHLPDTAAFVTAARTAVEVAMGGAIVAFGVRPTIASTAYGYILPGEPLGADGRAHRIARFAEKPPRDRAERYVAEGWLWNSGDFVFSVRAMAQALDLHAPAVAEAAHAAIAGLGSGCGRHRLGPGFAAAPKISIDYAVMERTDRAAVVALDGVWSDLGAWDAVHAASARDADGNVAPAAALLLETRDSLVRSATDQTVALVGLSGVGVVVEPDAILVTDLAMSQRVSQLADRLAAAPPPSVAQADPARRLKDQARRWDGWLRAAALPLWATVGADPQRGIFAEAVSQDVRPIFEPRRLRVAARQTYVYALAGQLGWAGPWRAAVRLGLDRLRDGHLRPQGGYRTRAAGDDSAADERAMLYDHAFVLLALAWAKRTGVAPYGEAEALALLETVIEPWRNPAGGFREADEARPWQSNPHMHLFEAALAWVGAGGDARWTRLAGEIGELALTRFVDPDTGAIREFFDADWRPAQGADGRRVEPGHQFEWAWLLGRWARMAGRPDAQRAAERLYELAVAYGVDRARNVAVDALSDDLSGLEAGARLWPQTERLKAALLMAEGAEGEVRAARLGEAADAADGLALYTTDVAPGLWRDKLGPDGGFVEEGAPASSLYHIACALAELFATAARL